MDFIQIDDKDIIMGLFSKVCTFCKHWHKTEGRKCDAFPDEIPDEIWLCKHDHKTPYKGNGGIRFERMEN
jgi:hypothetical protein